MPMMASAKIPPKNPSPSLTETLPSSQAISLPDLDELSASPVKGKVTGPGSSPLVNRKRERPSSLSPPLRNIRVPVKTSLEALSIDKSGETSNGSIPAKVNVEIHPPPRRSHKKDSIKNVKPKISRDVLPVKPSKKPMNSKCLDKKTLCKESSSK